MATCQVCGDYSKHLAASVVRGEEKMCCLECFEELEFGIIPKLSHLPVSQNSPGEILADTQYHGSSSFTADGKIHNEG